MTVVSAVAASAMDLARIVNDVFHTVLALFYGAFHQRFILCIFSKRNILYSASRVVCLMTWKIPDGPRLGNPILNYLPVTDPKTLIRKERTSEGLLPGRPGSLRRRVS